MTNAEAWFSNSLRPRKPEGSLGRTAQDDHLHSHTAPELFCPKLLANKLSTPEPSEDLPSYPQPVVGVWLPSLWTLAWVAHGEGTLAVALSSRGEMGTGKGVGGRTNTTRGCPYFPCTAGELRCERKARIKPCWNPSVLLAREAQSRTTGAVTMLVVSDHHLPYWPSTC